MSNDVKIIKVPLKPSEKEIYHPQVFPPMPILYLELIENKLKVKQDLINKDYNPATGAQTAVHGDYFAREKSKNGGPVEAISKKDGPGPNLELSDLKLSSSSSALSSTDESGSTSTNSSSSDVDSSSSNSDSASSDVSSSSPQNSNSSPDLDKYGEDDRELEARLKQFLGDSTESVDRRTRFDNSSSKFTPYNKYSDVPTQGIQGMPPTLSQLAATGQVEKQDYLRDINQIPINEIEQEDQKRELIFKFDLLRKKYPLSTVPIPEYSIHSDLNTMIKTYDDTLRRLSIYSTADTYKQYLKYGFFGVEYVMGKWLKFDMEGYSQQQILQINTYDALLIELGEKTYVPTGSHWPVELRLLGLIVMNTVMFIMAKMVMRGTGLNVNSMTTPAAAAPTPASRPKMRAPDINLDDIP